MRTTAAFFLCLPILLSSPRPVSAVNEARPAWPSQPRLDRPGWYTLWHDDLESGAPGWTHGDDSASSPKFHIDTYLAYNDPDHETDYSWWCGVRDAAYAGGDGYGNSWDQRLELPPIELGIVTTERTSWGAIKAMYREDAEGVQPRRPPARSVTPVLTFRYRYDTEAGYDFVWVQVESLGSWVDMNRGYNGSSGGWQDLGAGGFNLSDRGDPVRVRFRFLSDPMYSDEDAEYDSDGGAFHVDDICVVDAVTGEVFYREDCEGGAGLSQPSAPGPAGDYWHLVDNACQAYNGTRAWSPCYPDSASVPPGLQNWVMTPTVNMVYWGSACTLYYAHQMFMPMCWGGTWQEWSTNDGGATWTRTGWWYGDQCQYGYGPCSHFMGSIPITWNGHYGTGQVAAKWVILTGDEGNFADPDCSYLSAGFTIDEVRIEEWVP